MTGQNQLLTTLLGAIDKTKSDILAEDQTSNPKAKLSVKRPFDQKQVMAIEDSLKVPSSTAELLYHVADYAIDASSKGEVPLTPLGGKIASVTLPHTIHALYVKEETAKNKLAEPMKLSAFAGDLLRASAYQVRDGRMQLTLEVLEAWRTHMETLLTRFNQEGVTFEHELLQPQTWGKANFGKQLVIEIYQLSSGYPLDRALDWVKIHGNGDKTSVMLEVKTLTPETYCNLLVQRFREATPDKLSGADSFLDVLSHYSKSRQKKRGFHKAVAAVHAGMPPFNSRVAYPATYYTAYKVRYGNTTAETGLTADIMLAYCFYFGIHPLSLIEWLARRELKTQGHFKVHNVSNFEDMIEWQGALSPYEHDRFIQMVFDMGLVSDQKSWVLSLFTAGYVYRDIPSVDMVRARGSDNSAAIFSLNQAGWPLAGDWVNQSGRTAPVSMFLNSFSLCSLSKPVIDSLKTYAAIGAAQLHRGFADKVDGCGIDEVIAESEVYLGRVPPSEGETYGEYKLRFAALKAKVNAVYVGMLKELELKSANNQKEETVEESEAYDEAYEVGSANYSTASPEQPREERQTSTYRQDDDDEGFDNWDDE